MTSLHLLDGADLSSILHCLDLALSSFAAVNYFHVSLITVVSPSSS